MIRLTRPYGVAVVFAAVLAAAPAQAGVMDFLFGSKKTDSDVETKANPKRRTWQIGEFKSVQLVPKESGSEANQQPVSVQPEWLRQQLAYVRTTVNGVSVPLFAADELADLIEPIAQALSLAQPNDDLLLLSTARRGEGILVAPMGVTARLFAQGGNLNLIVRDARLDFVNNYRGSHVAPQFTFGSRSQAGSAVVQSANATSRRADWVAIPLTGSTTAAPAAAPAPMAHPSAQVAPAPAAPALVPAAKSRDAAFYEEQEQRLQALKRLRDKGLISEEEYQQKRKEILSSL